MPIAYLKFTGFRSLWDSWTKRKPLLDYTGGFGAWNLLFLRELLWSAIVCAKMYCFNPGLWDRVVSGLQFASACLACVLIWLMPGSLVGVLLKLDATLSFEVLISIHLKKVPKCQLCLDSDPGWCLTSSVPWANPWSSGKLSLPQFLYL